MTIQQVLQATGLPCVYTRFKDKNSPKSPPYIVYIGNGQDNFKADDTFYYSENRYQIEYYFTEKDETKEKAIEDTLLENGFRYSKSEDLYLESEGVFLIYYYV